MPRLLLTLTFFFVLFGATAQESPTAHDNEPLATQEPLSAYGNPAERSSRYAFSFLRPVHRGYDYRWRRVVLNGVQLNDPQTGLVPWATLGAALSGADITGYGGQSNVAGVESYEFDPLGRVGGGRAVAAVSNRTYSYRLQGSYDIVAPGWAVGVEVSRRWGRSMTTSGIFADVSGLTVVAAKRLDERNELRLTALFNPTERSYAAPTTAEATDLAGDRLYNPSWGGWNGRERSVNVRRTVEPVVMLNHSYNSGDLRLENAFYVSGGRMERTALTWASTPNPLPDYWAAMPSAQKGEHERAELERLWRTDPSIRQINFDRLTQINSHSPTARYAIENRVRDALRLTAQSTIEYGKWSGGAEFTYMGSDNYKVMDDLLGGTYWRDVDSFLEQDDDLRELTQNDMRNPDRQITNGDRFGYNYSLRTLRTSLWTGWNHIGEQWKLHATGSISARTDQRRGHYEKQNFPSGRSYGASQLLTSWEHLLSFGVQYAPSGRFSLGGSLAWQTVSPTGQEMFLAPRYRNAASPIARSFSMLSGNVFIRHATPNLRLDARAYYTAVLGRTSATDLYNDPLHQYVHYLMSDINTTHIGFEFFAEATLSAELYGSISLIINDSRYTSNPRAQAIGESTNQTMSSDVEVMYSGLHIGTPASQMASIGLSYRPYGWLAELRINGFAGGYATLAPVRRTYDALRGAANGDEMSRMQSQEQLPAGITLDLFVGRTWMLARGGRNVGIYAGVNNIFDNRNIVTTAYESGRLRNLGSSYSPAFVAHPTKYYHAMGLNFFVNLSYRF